MEADTSEHHHSSLPFFTFLSLYILVSSTKLTDDQFQLNVLEYCRKFEGEGKCYNDPILLEI